jgi:predicted ATPase/DNA-binding CsgD family transcriptional regulator
MVGQKVQTNNLPPQPTPFIGRKPEITQIINILRDEQCRLLTLVGPGGIGKTRLSIESISQLTANDFEHGVFYIPLASLASADNIVSTVISVLGILIGDDGTPLEELARFLSGRNLLLVMDNFEHVLSGADLVSDILNSAPNVKILATSREALNLRLERVWQVYGMRFPNSEEPTKIEQYSALKLFADRATWVQRDFNMDTQIDCIIQICRLVGGMPLGIELAAGWLKTLSCKDIIQEITQGIDFLSTRNRDVPERHRSIHAVFDHSWVLLSDAQRAVLPRLSVFRGAFTREAAEQIAGADLMLLSSLVEKSMVRRDASGRYSLHQLVRQYSYEKLDYAGDSEAISVAHAHYFADFMNEHTVDIKGLRQIGGLMDITADFDNITEAWYHIVDTSDFSALDKMMGGIVIYCEMKAQYQICEDLFRYAVSRLLSHTNNETDLRLNHLRVCWIRTWLLPERNPIPDSLVQQLKLCHKLAREQDNHLTIAWCLFAWGEFLRIDQNVNSEGTQNPVGFYLQSHQEFENLGHLYGVIRVLRGISYYYSIIQTDENNQFAEYNARYLSLAQEAGNIHATAHALAFSANASEKYGDMSSATKQYKESAEIFREMGDMSRYGVIRSAQAFGQLFAGHFKSANEYAKEASDVVSLANFAGYAGVGIAIRAFSSIVVGNYDIGRRLMQEAQEKSPVFWEFNHICERTLCIYALENYEYDKACGRLIAAFKYLKRKFQLIDATHWIAIAIPVIAYDGNFNLAAKLLGLVTSLPEDIIGWTRHWQTLLKLDDMLEGQLGQKSYHMAREQGAGYDPSLIVDDLIIYFGTNNKDDMKVDFQPLEEPLTKRELEILHLISDGLSNHEISVQLFLTVGTVKVHASNIYRKLDVKKRTQAVARARELRLL